MDDKILKAIERLLGSSLTNTKPLVITDTTANTGIDGFAIYGITDVTFTTLDSVTDGNDLSAATLPKGNIWYIPIKGTVELATGSAIVYRFNK